MKVMFFTWVFLPLVLTAQHPVEFTGMISAELFNKEVQIKAISSKGVFLYQVDHIGAFRVEILPKDNTQLIFSSKGHARTSIFINTTYMLSDTVGNYPMQEIPFIVTLDEGGSKDIQESTAYYISFNPQNGTLEHYQTGPSTAEWEEP